MNIRDCYKRHIKWFRLILIIGIVLIYFDFHKTLQENQRGKKRTGELSYAQKCKIC